MVNSLSVGMSLSAGEATTTARTIERQTRTMLIRAMVFFQKQKINKQKGK